MAPFARPARMVARGVSDAFARCLRSDLATPLDVPLAKRQHAAYVALIRDLGIEVELLPADAAHPDCCFVEDTAVVLGSRAVATRPGAPTREGEVGPVATVLAARGPVERMTPPATLDGGDVLRAGDHLFVGLSGRTNAEGRDVLARVAADEGITVVSIPVGQGLHLKSACSLVDGRTLVFAPDILGDEALASFRAAGLELVAAVEPAGANVLALGDVVLASAAAPETTRVLRARGHDVRSVDVGQMHVADGALTCLSLRVPAPGAWCT